jgi:hypothetical protein
MRFITSCKHCNKKFFLGFGFVHHLSKEHNLEATKNDKRCVRKLRLKFCLLPFALVIIIIRALLLGICFPFHWLYEAMTEYRI